MQDKKPNFEYQVKKSARRKTVSICVHPDNRIVVSAPYTVSQKRILQIVEKHSDWIQKKLQTNREKSPVLQHRRLENGRKLLYLGREYDLQIMQGSPSGVALNDGKILVQLPFDAAGPAPSAIRVRLVRWYADQAIARIKERVAHFSERIGVSPRAITLKSMRSRWGSCSSQGRISLAWNIIMAPEEIIDYLIVHELCHMVHHNHSSVYWDLVGTIIADHRFKRKWLTDNGGLLSL